MNSESPFPTLSQHNEKRRLTEQEREQKGMELLSKILQDCSRDIPLHHLSSEQYRSELRERVKYNNRISLYSINCDFCNVRMINPEPGSVLLSYPSKTYIACPGCGYKGTI